jgi:hypothetical protein
MWGRYFGFWARGLTVFAQLTLERETRVLAGQERIVPSELAMMRAVNRAVEGSRLPDGRQQTNNEQAAPAQC